MAYLKDQTGNQHASLDWESSLVALVMDLPNQSALLRGNTKSAVSKINFIHPFKN